MKSSLPIITTTTTSSSSTASETTSLLAKDNEKNNENDNISDHDKNLYNREWLLTCGALAASMLAQSYLLVSVFPYSGFMAMHLVNGLNEETAGSYAGLIASSFMIGRTISSYHWGKAADTYGRTFVIKTSLIMSSLFSLLFGLAPTFHTALLCRFALGLVNGLVGPVKTLVSEIAHGNESKETRTLALVMGMWGYGFLINPAIGGYLSDPVKQYPTSELVETFEPILKQFPFILPNIVGSMVCLLSYFLICCYVQETLPQEKLQQFNLLCCIPKKFKHLLTKSTSSWITGGSVQQESYNDKNTEIKEDKVEQQHQQQQQQHDDDDVINVPKWVRPSPSTTALVILDKDENDKNNNPELQQHQQQQNYQTTTTNHHLVESTSSSSSSSEDDDNNSNSNSNSNSNNNNNNVTIASLWSRKTTRSHLLVYWFYSFNIVCIDETFPLYCISKQSGLGVPEMRIGNIFTGCGLFYITIQYLLITKLVDQFGLYKSLRIGALLSVPMCVFIPISLLTNRNTPANEGTLTISTFLFLSINYAIIRTFSSVTFSTLTLTTNRTVPSHCRATMNGLSMLGGSIAKGTGPAGAGILFSFSVGHFQPPYGSILLFCLLSLSGLTLFIQTLFLHEYNTTTNTNNKDTTTITQQQQQMEKDNEEQENNNNNSINKSQQSKISV